MFLSFLTETDRRVPSRTQSPISPRTGTPTSLFRDSFRDSMKSSYSARDSFKTPYSARASVKTPYAHSAASAVTRPKDSVSATLSAAASKLSAPDATKRTQKPYGKKDKGEGQPTRSRTATKELQSKLFMRISDKC